MRGLTTVAILLVALLGLGSYIYVQSKRAPGSSSAEPKAAEIPKDEIEQLVIKSAGGEVSTVTKTGGTWQITSPLTAAADEKVIAAIVAQLGELRATRIVDEKPTDLSQYGLAPARVEVTVKSTGAAGTQHLLLGDKATTGGGVYAQLSSAPRLFLLAAGIDEAVNKTAFDLRDKAVFKADRDKIDSLEIVAAGRTVQLVKQDVEWAMTKPINASTELGVISQLLTTLTSLQATSFIDSEGASPVSYRLDQPVATVTVMVGSSSETLQVGARADESNTYARSLSRPIVFTIPTAVADALKDEPAHYRRKEVFAFQSMDTTHIEVVRGGRTTVYEKAAAPAQNGDWREVSPTARNIEPAKMDTALSKLSYLRAVTFVPRPAGLTPGSGAISVLVQYDEGKKSESVQLAKLGSTPFAVRADWPDAARLDPGAYALLVASLDDLQK